ncbi:MAG: hypothetical protein ABIB43_01305 [archaeon]
MSLQDLVKETKELNESVLVVDLNNGFSIGLERVKSHDSKTKDLKYRLLYNTGSNIGYMGSNAKFVSNGEYSSFSSDAERMLEKYTMTLQDLTKPIDTKIGELYDKVLAPIEIQPVKKRNFSYLLPAFGITLTYPISVPAIFIFAMVSKMGGTVGAGLMRYALYAPLQIPEAIRYAVHPSIKGVKVTNKEVFSEKPENENYVAVTDFGENFNPDFFGDSSSLKGRKVFLHATFPDGLELTNSWLSYHNEHNSDIKNPYSSTKLFLPVDKELSDQAHSLYNQYNQMWSDIRDFRDNIKPKEIAATLKTLKIL